MTLEGVMAPNTRLDRADAMAVTDPGALCALVDGRLLITSGNAVLALDHWGATPVTWAQFDRPVSALAASDNGLVCVALAGGGGEVRDLQGETTGWTLPSSLPELCDVMFMGDGEIAGVVSGYSDMAEVLACATWDDAALGQVVAMRRDGSTRQLARGLHCPLGIAPGQAGKPVVSLMERATIADLSGHAVQTALPAYLGRIRRIETGYLIACLSRRDPLIEFLKTEQDFVAAMKQGIDPKHWISPRAVPEFTHDFPIELGATRLFGEIKPWAPSFSYGLIIETDRDFVPVGSAHSRANGTRHAITDTTLWNGVLVAVSQASGEVLNLPQTTEAP